MFFGIITCGGSECAFLSGLQNIIQITKKSNPTLELDDFGNIHSAFAAFAKVMLFLPKDSSE